MKFIIKKRYLIIAIIVVVAIAFVIALRSGKSNLEYSTVVAQKIDLSQTVSEVGSVKSVSELELSFAQSGKLASLSVRIGDDVEADQILAEMDYSTLLIRKNEAYASIAVAEANLGKLLRGATYEELAVQRAQVEQAEVAYLNALDNFEKTKKNIDENIIQKQKTLDDLRSSAPGTLTSQEQAVLTAENSLANTKKTYQQSIDSKTNSSLSTLNRELSVANTGVDNINRVLGDNDIQGVFSIMDQSYKSKTINAKSEAITLIRIASDDYDKAYLGSERIDIETALTSATKALKKTYEALNYCYNALEKTIISASFTQTELDTLKSTISGQMTLVNTGISALQTASYNLDSAYLAYTSNVSSAENALFTARANMTDAVRTAENNLASALTQGNQQLASAEASTRATNETLTVTKKQYDKVFSGSRQEDIDLAKANLRQAQSSLELIEKQIEDSKLKSPIRGKIIESNFWIGEQVGAGIPVVSILAENNFEIEVDISEADIAKIRKDNSVRIDLDAFGDGVVYSGVVNFIEPAATVIQEVIYYKLKIRITDGDIGLLRSGMTANVEIMTADKKDVLTVPSRAILDKDGMRFVRVLEMNKVREVPVELGLRGDGGIVEIVSGLSGGEAVVTSVKDNGK